MVKVIVKNNTSVIVKIQEGNAGVFQTRHTLRPKDEYTLKLDPNATYREYVLIKLPDQRNLDPPFSSDDLAGLRKILIEEDKSVEPSMYSWKGIHIGQKSEEDFASFLKEIEGRSSEVGSSSKVGNCEKVGDRGGKASDVLPKNESKGRVSLIQKLKNIFSL